MKETPIVANFSTFSLVEFLALEESLKRPQNMIIDISHIPLPIHPEFLERLPFPQLPETPVSLSLLDGLLSVNVYTVPDDILDFHDHKYFESCLVTEPPNIQEARQFITNYEKDYAKREKDKIPKAVRLRFESAQQEIAEHTKIPVDENLEDISVLFSNS